MDFKKLSEKQEAKLTMMAQMIDIYAEEKILKAQIDLLDEIYQACFQEDSRTIELVEDKLLELRRQWRKTIS